MTFLLFAVFFFPQGVGNGTPEAYRKNPVENAFEAVSKGLLRMEHRADKRKDDKEKGSAGHSDENILQHAFFHYDSPLAAVLTDYNRRTDFCPVSQGFFHAGIVMSIFLPGEGEATDCLSLYLVHPEN